MKMKMKKITLFAVLALVLTSCSQQAVITVDDFASKAPGLEGQTVILQGTATHVCSKSGRKVFLAGESEDASVTVFAGENMGKYDPETIGKVYTVKGKVIETARIDNAYLDEWQNEVMEGAAAEGHDCEHEQSAMGLDAEAIALAEDPQLAEIRQYREKIAANGGNDLVFYGLEAKSFTVK